MHFQSDFVKISNEWSLSVSIRSNTRYVAVQHVKENSTNPRGLIPVCGRFNPSVFIVEEINCRTNFVTREPIFPKKLSHLKFQKKIKFP